MSSVRTFLPVAFLLAVANGLGGCYDLSDPSGPHREDFVPSHAAAATREQGTTADPRCPTSPCNASDDISRRLAEAVQTRDEKSPSATDNHEDKVKRELRVVPVDPNDTNDTPATPP